MLAALEIDGAKGAKGALRTFSPGVRHGARASRHRNEDAVFAPHDGIDCAVDGDLLVIARWAFGVGVERRENPFDCGRRKWCGSLQARPQLISSRETINAPLNSGRVVELDDAFTIGGIGELQIKNLGVFLRLGET